MAASPAAVPSPPGCGLRGLAELQRPDGRVAVAASGYLVHESLTLPRRLGQELDRFAGPAELDQRHLGVPKPVVGITVPTGHSYNLDGTAIHLTMASLFIASGMGAPMSSASRSVCWSS